MPREQADATPSLNNVFTVESVVGILSHVATVDRNDSPVMLPMIKRLPMGYFY